MFDINKLKEWFAEEKRDLPWRKNCTPYAIWISEMMLQQTQVSVVIPYFERWMQLFPTIHSLAEADLDAVIKAWEGLGYYTRARFLHEGAKKIQNDFNGIFPKDSEDLKKIKGLGPYTLGAIRSFAFHQKTPAVDGNVIRVLCRYFMIEDDIVKQSTIKKIWTLADHILPDVEPWVVNEALIELGATICTKKPKCLKCPLRSGCKGYAYGKTETLPLKSKKVKIESLYRAVAIISHEEKFLIKRCRTGEIMSDLHEFPYFETNENGISERTLQNKVNNLLDCKVFVKEPLPMVAQSFTRYRVSLSPIKFICKSDMPPSVEHPFQWLTLSELSKLAFSSGHRKIFNSLLQLV